MKLEALVKAAVQKRQFAIRRAYLPFALVAAFFALYGWGNEGFYAACPYLLLLLVCLFQAAYPTLLGWGLLFGLSLAYTLLVAFSPQNGTRDDYIFFLLCGAVPAAVLFFLRPTTRKRDRS